MNRLKASALALALTSSLWLPSVVLVAEEDAAGEDEGDVVRAVRIRELIWGEVQIEGDVTQYVTQLRTEIKSLEDKQLREDLLVELGKKFGMPGDTSPRPEGGGPKPGESGFSETVVLGLRRNMLPEWRQNSPNNPVAWAENGYLDCSLQNYRACLANLGRAIDLGIKDPKAYATYGSAAHNLGDYKLALKAASAALKLDPGHEGAHAVYKLSEGRVSTVELPSSLHGDIFGGAPALPAEPAAVDAPPPAQAAGAVVPGREAGPAPVVPQETQRRMTAAEVERSAVFTRQAAASLAVRDYVQAHEAASRAIQINLRNAQAWNYRAIANNKLDRYQDAVYDASFALNLAPGNAAALQSRSWAHNKSGKYQEALADANFTLEREPGNAFAFQNRAFAQAGLKDRVGMLESLKRSAELDPRFKQRYDAALQAPASGDILYLFDEESSAGKAAPPASPERMRKRFLTLSAAVVSGGLLMALGLLHIVSSAWREKVRSTVRRVLGVPTPSSGPSDPATGSPASGGFWGQYRLIREVGLGGMGVVYEAVDTALDRRVAIKKMRDEIRLDRRERERFLQEARTVASLKHPNIVEIFSIVEDGGDVYLVFEFADGRTLSALLEEAGKLPFEKAKAVLKDACEAVDCAHRHKVVHRDIKPSNIMVTESGAVKVMDFGVARQAKEAATKVMTNTVAGTPPYMAPEAEQGTVGPQSDVYGLGVVFYELLSGELPFAGHGAGMLLNKLNGKFIPLSQAASGLPTGIDAVMARVLSPDPAKRYKSPTEFFQAVQGLS
ncbi:MAG: protein kinase [Elusimicrobia bacterium]|nr:protein kinase [Elusimicrobiota bacterium]